MTTEEERVERESAWCISLGNGLSVQHTPEAEAHWQAVVDEDDPDDDGPDPFPPGTRVQVEEVDGGYIAFRIENNDDCTCPDPEIAARSGHVSQCATRGTR